MRRGSGRSRRSDRRKVWQRVHVHLVCALLSEVLHVHTLLGLDEGYELVAVLADDDGPEVAGGVVPGHSVLVLIVEDGQASLVVELLKSLNGDTDVVRRVNGTLLVALPVVRLWLSFFSGVAPESIWMRLISGWDTSIICPGPEPSIRVNWL